MYEAEATTEWGRGPLWGRGRGHIIWPRGRADLEALTSLVSSPFSLKIKVYNPCER